jgi:lycopene cyclase domain-containing protein
MTYACFLVLFLLLPLALVSLVLRRRLLNWRYWLTTAQLLLVVLPTMALWDHAAVVLGVWGWTPQQTWGVRLWLIPLEEYLFALLETVLLTMLMYALLLWTREGAHALGRKRT